MIGVCADITERRSNAGLPSVKAMSVYRSIVEGVNEGVWLVDTQGRTLYANWRLSLMLGYTADEFMGRNCPVLFSRGHPGRPGPH